MILHLLLVLVLHLVRAVAQAQLQLLGSAQGVLCDKEASPAALACVCFAVALFAV